MDKILVKDSVYKKLLVKKPMFLGKNGFQEAVEWRAGMGGMNEQAKKKYPDCDTLVCSCVFSGISYAPAQEMVAFVTKIKPEEITGVVLWNEDRSVTYGVDL